MNNKNTVTSVTSFWFFIVNFEHISNLFSNVSIVDFEQVNVSWKFFRSSNKTKTFNPFETLETKTYDHWKLY